MAIFKSKLSSDMGPSNLRQQLHLRQLIPLKFLMNLNQLQVNNFSVVKEVGKAFGLLAGLAGLASDRFPTWALLLIGSIEGLIGYGVQWLVISQRISPIPYWQMCVFLCLGGNSTTWMNTSVLVTCIPPAIFFLCKLSPADTLVEEKEEAKY